MKLTIFAKDKNKFRKYLESVEKETLKKKKSITSSLKVSSENYNVFEWEVDTHNSKDNSALVLAIRQFSEHDKKFRMIVEQ